MTRLTIVGISFIFCCLMFVGLSYAKIDEESIIGMWLFNEGKGDVVSDSSGNGNDGALMNDPKWVDGKFGKALSFDGVDDYVDCGSNGSLSVTETTMMAFLNPNSISLRHAITGKQGAYSFKIWEVGKLAFTTPGIRYFSEINLRFLFHRFFPPRRTRSRHGEPRRISPCNSVLPP